MFKTKWHKKYDKAMETVEFWRDYHRKQMEVHHDNQQLFEMHFMEAMTLDDVLRDMKKIAKRG
jgi:hypothetical protein